MEGLGNSIKEAAERLLNEGDVDLVIGYERGTTPLRSTPCFIRDSGDVDRLIWDPTCDANLAKYLIGQDAKIGIFVKGCDARSAVVCIAEGQIDRDKVVLIGLPCSGVIDRKKIDSVLDGREVLDATVDEVQMTIRGEDFEEKLPTKDFLCNSCLSCGHRTPAVYDIMIGETPTEEPDTDEYADVDELESMTAVERWAHFVEELSGCIRCYSCRNVCPMCYCKECFVDETMPAWFGKTTELSDTMIYHLVRSLHMAGRCVDCGACSRACPMNIDLRILTKKIEKIVKERFDFEAGLDPEETPVMGAFKQEDSEEFML